MNKTNDKLERTERKKQQLDIFQKYYSRILMFFLFVDDILVPNHFGCDQMQKISMPLGLFFWVSTKQDKKKHTRELSRREAVMKREWE